MLSIYSYDPALKQKVIIYNNKFVQTTPDKAVQIQMTHEQHR